ncbi:MAG: hypothetical protein LBQ16_00530 [Gracilibacteraceae bacterium]|nr:hypothetical protein [Gracilibacteraceae bacterium]
MGQRQKRVKEELIPVEEESRQAELRALWQKVAAVRENSLEARQAHVERLQARGRRLTGYLERMEEALSRQPLLAFAPAAGLFAFKFLRHAIRKKKA